MHNRIKTALFLASAFLAALLFFSPFVIASIISLISFMAYYEWLTLIGTQSGKKNLFLSLFLVLMILLVNFSSHQLTTNINFIYLMFWLLVSIDIFFGSRIARILLKESPSIIGLFVMLFSWYLLLSFNTTNSTIVSDGQGLLFSYESFSDNLNYYFIFLFTLVSLSDTSAYIIGKRFGSVSLVKAISPNKTLEGFISSLFFPTFITYLLLTYLFNIPVLLPDLLFLLLCCSYCTIGDLFISILKRNYKVKDTGELLPGHGGILDRIDSYLPVIPIFQFWLFL